MDTSKKKLKEKFTLIALFKHPKALHANLKCGKETS
jgi:hypothetical protein